MSAALLGREEELDAVRAFLAAARRQPAVLVLAGEPGIGKTALWRAGVECARDAGGRVLPCRGVEAEATFAFSGLGDLLRDVLDETLRSLARPRRRALEIALLLEEPGAALPDRHAITLGVLDLLRRLAASGPVLVAVDDLQWLDPSSARVLQGALRRLRDEPIGLLCTARPERAGDLPFELERSLPGLTRLLVGPLSHGALYRLLRERLGIELTRPELVRLHEVTGGNPLFALEIGRELAQRQASFAPGEPLPVPANLRRLLGRRLARLRPATREALLGAAALASPTVELLAALQRRGATAALEEALRAGVIEVVDSRVVFTHPLLASACYEEAGIERRRAVHRRLAAVVVGLEERARHLALATEAPSAEIASSLDAAAEQAAGRGATAAAAELRELAARLTPAEDEGTRRRRLLQAADFHCYAGNKQRAAEIPARLLEEVPPGPERAEVLYKLASARAGDHGATIELCEQALVEAAGDDARSAEILVFRSWLRMLAGDVRGASEDARVGLARAERVGDPKLRARAIGRVAAAENWTLEITPGLLERGLALEEQLERPLEYPESPLMAFGRRLTMVGEFERARSVLAREERRAAARGDEIARAHLLFGLVVLEWHAGRWRRALDDADAAVELAEQIHDDLCLGLALGGKAFVEADLGRTDDARLAAERAIRVGEAIGDALVPIWGRGVLGHLDLSLGNFVAAARQLAPLPARLASLGWNDVTDPIWPDAIESLIAVGELSAAGGCLERYRECAERLGSAWVLAVADRVDGLAAAAGGEVPAALESLERARAAHERTGTPFELARTLLALGSVGRRARQKRSARDALERARAIFDELEAPSWSSRASAELARIGGRPPAAAALTPTEERVASLAADGLSNKEIAAALFVTVHTVEAHLSRVYRKLELRSRAELGRRIAAKM